MGQTIEESPTQLDLSAAESPRRDLKVREPTPMTVIEPTPMMLLAEAHRRGASIEELRMLMDLRDREEATQARRAYTAAMVQFKAEPPKIFKTKQVSFEKKSGGVTDYKHATLGHVNEPIIKALAAVDIRHAWQLSQPDRACVEVTCTLTHKLGHSESVTMRSLPDDSAGKNSIQAIASAVNYLQRYTLLSITGLATFDLDDDGKGADGLPDYIDEKAVADFNAFYTQLGFGEKHREKVCKQLGVDNFGHILKSKHKELVSKLRALGEAAEEARREKLAGKRVQK